MTHDELLKAFSALDDKDFLDMGWCIGLTLVRRRAAGDESESTRLLGEVWQALKPAWMIAQRRVDLLPLEA